MNGPKKFLCKKRKNKIFSIKKLRNKEEKIKNPKYSLIEISKLVLNFIKQEKYKTGNEITEYVLNYLKPGNDEKIQKNIQRRVYDSINVMNAAGLIQKNKQGIKYIPRKDKNNNEKIQITNINKTNSMEINTEKNIKEINSKKQEYLDKLKQLNLLQQILIKKYITLKIYENKSNISNDNTKEKKVIKNTFNITNNKIKNDSKNIKDNEELNKLDNKCYNTNFDKKRFHIIKINNNKEDNNHLNKGGGEFVNIGNIKLFILQNIL